MPMIARNLTPLLLEKATHYPVVTVTGPRQSGKTTLCRALFADKPYVSLESPDLRRQALDDPSAFLRRFKDGAVFDEGRDVDVIGWRDVHTVAWD